MKNKSGQLLEITDNMRLMDALAESGKLPERDARKLQAAYLAYRDASHRAALAKRGSLVSAEAFADHREHILALWRRWMEPAAEREANDQ